MVDDFCFYQRVNSPIWLTMSLPVERSLKIVMNEEIKEKTLCLKWFAVENSIQFNECEMKELCNVIIHMKYYLV